jgi:cyclic pyranopterin phosphate synthase
VRITGGEPLVHPEIVEIVRSIARVPGIEDVALTTNATLLTELAAPLRDAGLSRINVSCDSLDPARYARLTRGGRLDVVLAGIEAARAVGFSELKTNTVVLGPLAAAGDEIRDDDELRNDDELPAITRWAWSIGATPRFIELMTIGEGARFSTRIVPYAQMRAQLAHLVVDAQPVRDEARGPATYVAARDGGGRVGFITGSTNTFCAGCDRLRATSDGQLRPCRPGEDAPKTAPPP